MRWFYLFSLIFALVMIRGICGMQGMNNEIEIVYHNENCCFYYWVVVKNHPEIENTINNTCKYHNDYCGTVSPWITLY